MAEHITIGDVAPRVQYVADGVLADFTYPFPIFAEEDLEILDWVEIKNVDRSAGAMLSGEVAKRYKHTLLTAWKLLAEPLIA